jgi:hypothetical protein
MLLAEESSAVRGCHMAQSKKSTAGKVRLILESETEVEHLSKTSYKKQLSGLVRLLARQAARDFARFEAERKDADDLSE